MEMVSPTGIALAVSNVVVVGVKYARRHGALAGWAKTLVGLGYCIYKRMPLDGLRNRH